MNINWVALGKAVLSLVVVGAVIVAVNVLADKVGKTGLVVALVICACALVYGFYIQYK